ncbi:hypothetical protein HK102_004939, partial [Quaeritorhiza haematococci]
MLSCQTSNKQISTISRNPRYGIQKASEVERPHTNSVNAVDFTRSPSTKSQEVKTAPVRRPCSSGGIRHAWEAHVVTQPPSAVHAKLSKTPTDVLVVKAAPLKTRAFWQNIFSCCLDFRHLFVSADAVVVLFYSIAAAVEVYEDVRTIESGAVDAANPLPPPGNLPVSAPIGAACGVEVAYLPKSKIKPNSTAVLSRVVASQSVRARAKGGQRPGLSMDEQSPNKSDGTKDLSFDTKAWVKCTLLNSSELGVQKGAAHFPEPKRTETFTRTVVRGVEGVSIKDDGLRRLVVKFCDVETATAAYDSYKPREELAGGAGCVSMRYGRRGVVSVEWEDLVVEKEEPDIAKMSGGGRAYRKLLRERERELQLRAESGAKEDSSDAGEEEEEEEEEVEERASGKPNLFDLLGGDDDQKQDDDDAQNESDDYAPPQKEVKPSTPSRNKKKKNKKKGGNAGGGSESPTASGSTQQQQGQEGGKKKRNKGKQKAEVQEEEDGLDEIDRSLKEIEEKFGAAAVVSSTKRTASPTKGARKKHLLSVDGKMLDAEAEM